MAAILLPLQHGRWRHLSQARVIPVSRLHCTRLQAMRKRVDAASEATSKSFELLELELRTLLVAHRELAIA